MAFTHHSTAAVSLQPGDVIYAKDWSYCYRVVSAPFCRLRYCRWQGHLAAGPEGHPGHITVLIQALGGQRIDQLRLR